MSLTLVAVLCHQLGTLPEVCVEEVVPQTAIERQAGKIDAPLPMAEMSMHECIIAIPLVAKWVQENPVYRAWNVREVHCARDYVPKGKA
jgi:hypothetical protein